MISSNRLAPIAVPQPGDIYLEFNGRDNYVEIPAAAGLSATTTGELTIAAWMKPNTLNFQKAEGTGYIHWLGKGDGGEQEWAFRMYNHDYTRDDPPRPNRISFYVFNPDGGLGVGSHFQDTLVAGAWMHIVGVMDDSRILIYRDGVYRECYNYRGLSDGRCHIQRFRDSNEPVVIDPQPGNAPLRLGTRDRKSFLEGGLTKVRIWSRALAAEEIAGLFSSDAAPANGLVAEYLLNADTGDTAVDTAQGNDGTIAGAVWKTQD
jgi:hypothetical protein